MARFTVDGVKICVIFNPAACGEKARQLFEQVQSLGQAAELKRTTGPGSARSLARQAADEGFETIIAAGGDGTLHEVLNGIGDAPQGFEKARLGVLPIGTVNVFAREIGFPLSLKSAWQTIVAGREAAIDLARAKYWVDGAERTRFFIQLAGVGLDARAVHLVSWELKKRAGAIAYVVAGLKALRGPRASITVEAEGQRCAGELVLVGNGRFYGGPWPVFRRADMRDGLLDVCVFARVNWFTITRYVWSLMGNRVAGREVEHHFQSARILMSGPAEGMVELDGEWVGHVPCDFSVEPRGLRVIVP